MKKRILVIDDEASIRKSFKLSLEDTGYQVDEAESGMKGIEMERANKYDLIFLDLKMPGMNGIQTLRKLREINQAKPIYIVTTFYGEFMDDLKKAQKDGVYFEVLQKPIGADQIVLVCKSLLEGPIAH